MRRACVFVIQFAAVTFGVAVAAFCFTGWTEQNKDNGKVKVYPVEGALIVSGRPATHATLAFHALDTDRAGGPCPVGLTSADGTFRLMTYSQDDGAPAGEYVVTLYWPHDPQFATGVACECSEITTHDRLFGRYGDPATSELRATIRPERNAITLYATVGGSGWDLPRLNGAIKKLDERKVPKSDADLLLERRREIELDRAGAKKPDR